MRELDTSYCWSFHYLRYCVGDVCPTLVALKLCASMVIHLLRLLPSGLLIRFDLSFLPNCPARHHVCSAYLRRYHTRTPRHFRPYADVCLILTARMPCKCSLCSLEPAGLAFVYCFVLSFGFLRLPGLLRCARALWMISAPVALGPSTVVIFFMVLAPAWWS